MIGSARVVALSEGVHGAAEPLEFRNRMLQFLVREMGFTAIAIESGVVEARLVHEYVRKGIGDLSTVLSQGLSWGWDHLPQNRALVEWLRRYNSDPGRARKVNFYGFDVSGSPGSPEVTRGPDTALTETLRFLNRVDGPAGRRFCSALEPLVARMHLSIPPSSNALGYAGLSHIERDALTAGIADLVSLLEREEARYVAASSPGDYRWAYRAAIGARQIDNWLRQFPPGADEEGAWLPAGEAFRFFSAATNVRDRAQAENLEWILREEGPDGKVLVFAARFHLSAMALRARFTPDSGEHEQQVAGTYLRRRLGHELVTVCNLIGRGRTACGKHSETLHPPPSDSIDGLAAEVGAPVFLLDLRRAPTEVRRWLSQDRELVAGGQRLTLPLSEAFDILFYLDAVMPASGGPAPLS